MRLEELIKEILRNNIFITGITLIDDILQYEVNGFYKSGSVSLYETEEGIFVKARYEEVDKIESFEDLVYINYRWWLRSKERFEGWSVPNENWLPHLLKYGYIKETTKTTKEYE